MFWRFYLAKYHILSISPVSYEVYDDITGGFVMGNGRWDPSDWDVYAKTTVQGKSVVSQFKNSTDISGPS